MSDHLAATVDAAFGLLYIYVMPANTSSNTVSQIQGMYTGRGGTANGLLARISKLKQIEIEKDEHLHPTYGIAHHASGNRFLQNHTLVVTCCLSRWGQQSGH